MKPGLTVIVVFRDGEAILRRCLESIKEIASEIVAVNTGCTDGCVDVAKAFGARIFDFPWSDAFDEAYNFAFDKVETEWTFWLDSDEWLVPNSRSLLEKAIEYDAGFAYTVIREDELDDVRISEMRQPRLWRTHPLMRLEGVIHCQFPRQALIDAAGGRKLIHTELRIRHDGFKGGISKEKLKRNLILLEKELALRPGRLYFEVAYCENLLLLEDQRGVALLHALLPKAFSSDSRPEEICGGLLAAGLRVGLPKEFTIIRANEIEIKWFSASPNVMWELATAYFREQQYIEAVVPINLLWKMATTKNYSRHGLSDPDVLGSALGNLMVNVGRRIGDVEMLNRGERLCVS